jgi:hypothetical protein
MGSNCIIINGRDLLYSGVEIGRRLVDVFGCYFFRPYLDRHYGETLFEVPTVPQIWIHKDDRRGPAQKRRRSQSISRVFP